MPEASTRALPASQFGVGGRGRTSRGAVWVKLLCSSLEPPAAHVVKRFTKPGPTPTPASPCTSRVAVMSMLTSNLLIVGHGLVASHAATARPRHLQSTLAEPSIISIPSSVTEKQSQSHQPLASWQRVADKRSAIRRLCRRADAGGKRCAFLPYDHWRVYSDSSPQAARGRTSAATLSPTSLCTSDRSCADCRLIQNCGVVPK